MTVLISLESFACFDTFLFQQKRGMVYPYKMLAIETNGEYIVPDVKTSATDLFSGNLNIYYGITKWASLQVQFASTEKERHLASLDEVGVRGVFSLIRKAEGRYNLDLILEHHEGTTNSGQSFEFSVPNIWHRGSMTYVLHPVVAFTKGASTSLRGHSGVFYTTNRGTLLGAGAEYESAQSSSNFSNRLVKGAFGTSLFFGTCVSPNIFLQNELIKGWGAEGNDIGFALTLKVFFPNLTK